ncbi:hypothetical protein [Streptomyces sp. NRRL S-87]|uniref:hypothetical protein n=1 Tax=Streptomyces sp. NRRL S-87 TaxID=1463920 RepID=UPI0004C28CA6|nr:hypothetical protein [Streptomyces sp. NRRL S-87]
MNAAQRAARTRANHAQFWNARQAAAKSPREFAGLMVEYAKATAKKRADRETPEGANPDDHQVWRELAELLHTWAQRHIA